MLFGTKEILQSCKTLCEQAKFVAVDEGEEKDVKLKMEKISGV